MAGRFSALLRHLHIYAQCEHINYLKLKVLKKFVLDVAGQFVLMTELFQTLHLLLVQFERVVLKQQQVEEGSHNIRSEHQLSHHYHASHDHLRQKTRSRPRNLSVVHKKLSIYGLIPLAKLIDQRGSVFTSSVYSSYNTLRSET